MFWHGIISKWWILPEVAGQVGWAKILSIDSKSIHRSIAAHMQQDVAVNGQRSFILGLVCLTKMRIFKPSISSCEVFTTNDPNPCQPCLMNGVDTSQLVSFIIWFPFGRNKKQQLHCGIHSVGHPRLKSKLNPYVLFFASFTWKFYYCTRRINSTGGDRASSHRRFSITL